MLCLCVWFVWTKNGSSFFISLSVCLSFCAAFHPLMFVVKIFFRSTPTVNFKKKTKKQKKEALYNYSALRAVGNCRHKKKIKEWTPSTSVGGMLCVCVWWYTITTTSTTENKKWFRKCLLTETKRERFICISNDLTKYGGGVVIGGSECKFTSPHSLIATTTTTKAKFIVCCYGCSHHRRRRQKAFSVNFFFVFCCWDLISATLERS